MELLNFQDFTINNISTVTKKKKDQLEKHKVKLDTDESGIIKFVIPEAFWGSGNRTKEAFSSKLMKLNEGNYELFIENNLFLFAEDEEEYEILALIEHIKAYGDDARSFNFIYVYTYKKLYEISSQDFSFKTFFIDAEVSKNLILESAKEVERINEKKLIPLHYSS